MSQPQSPFLPRSPLSSALALAAAFAAFIFLIHVFTSLWGIHLGYGYFRDEFYFLMCGRRLAWGYVDQPPLVALQARLAETLFGIAPTSIRLFSFAAHGITVGLTGLLTWQFGGRRAAQFAAMSAIAAAPVFLGTGSYLSMNSFEPALWMGALFAVLRIADGSASPRAWLLFGLLAGLAVENKHSTVFFLIALSVGLLISPQRRLLFTRACLAGVALLLLFALPNLLWQWTHQFPTYQMLANVAHSDKNLKLPPPRFLWDQIKVLLYTTAPLWIGGLAWLALARDTRPWRFAAYTYLAFLAMMMFLHAKNYYVAPIYPFLFAAGAAALGQLIQRDRLLILIGAQYLLGLVFFTGPITLSVLPPRTYLVYTAPFAPNSARSEKYTSPLPQILSDRFGWTQMVQGFATRFQALPPEVRATTGIICNNYGEAGAVDILGPAYGLPPAISGHVNYFLWGWNGYTGDSMLTLGASATDFTSQYAEVVDLGPFDDPWSMDFEQHLHYFWLRHRKLPYAANWPTLKFWQ